MQAARGASLTTSDQTEDQTRPRRRLGLLLAVGAVLYAVDVVTKVLAVEHLDARGRVDLLGPLLGLNLAHNPGAAFSLGTESTVVLTFLAIGAVVVVLVMAPRVRETWWAVALGLLLAGVGGNLTDRLLREPGPLRGHVVDFLQLPYWPIFNVADMCICTAAGIIIVQSFRGLRLDGSRHGEPDADADTEAGETGA